MVVCSNCNARHRADKLIDECWDANVQDAESLSLDDMAQVIETFNIPCPECNETSTLGTPRHFNLLFETTVGPMQNTA